METSAKDGENIAKIFSLLTSEIIRKLTVEDKMKDVQKGTATLNNKVEKEKKKDECC